MNNQNLTGFPSIDKPWMKYYSEKAKNAKLPECTIYKYLWDNNKDYLDNTALNYYGRKISYGEMFANINKAAKAFYALGVRAGDIVVMTAVTTPETVYSFYGLNRLGAISNMVDPRTSEEGIMEYIKEVNAECVLTIDAALPKIKKAVMGTSVKKIIVVSPADSLPQPKKAAFILSNKIKGTTPKLFNHCICWKAFIEFGNNEKPVYSSYKKDSCCVIVHTGGTTGSPKGVMLSNENINVSAFQGFTCGFDFRREHSWLNIMPPFIAYGLCNGLHMPLFIGMEVVLIPAFDPSKYDRLLTKYKPNHIVGVPSHYGGLSASKKLSNADLSYLITPIIGGDSINVELEKDTNSFLNRHGCKTLISKGYGMTEVCAAVTACSTNACNKLGSVGIPLPLSTVSIFDTETRQELTLGQIGEVCMNTPNTMLGYYKRTKETDEILMVHEDGMIWVHSGDLGYIDEDGCLFIEGRLKRMIIRYDGFKVFPLHIEKTVIKCNNIISCCVVGIKDPDHIQGKLPKVYSVLKDKSADKGKIKAELELLCRRELPEYAQPVDFAFIDELPLTPIGKVDYRALEALAEKEYQS